MQNSLVLVTSHPDDESMFFIPTIKHYKALKYNICLLCLSGDNLRSLELSSACSSLGISIVCIGHCRDGFDSDWRINQSDIIEDIETFVTNNSASIVVTFDALGVSYHPNHIQTSYIVQAWFESTCLNVKLFMLTSTNIFRKYIGVFDLFFSICEADDVLITSINPPLFSNYMAMFQHWSQLVWYRQLFVFFSRYSYINTLKRVNFS